MDVTIAKLREDLLRLKGPARLPGLVRLGELHATSYWRAGPRTAGALSDLSDAIAAFDEAYELLQNDDPARWQIAARLGWLLSLRHTVHGGSVQDRETGIALLSTALSGPELPPVQTTLARMGLGQLHLSRGLEAVNPAAMRGGFEGGVSAASKADVDKAIECFREVLAGAAIGADHTQLIQALLGLAEAILPLLSGDLATLDISKIISAMAMVQQLQGGRSPMTPGAPGMGLSPCLMDFSKADPLDYPVFDLQGGALQTPIPAPRRSAPALVAPVDPYSARRTARSRLEALSGVPERPVWEQVLALLQAGPEQLAAADLDALIGAAMNAADGDEQLGASLADAVQCGPDDPVESGLDHLLAAVGLCLRERRDGSGWGDEEDATVNLAAVEQLLAAAKVIPSDHPAAAAVVEALGGMLDEARPLAGVVAGQFEAYAEKASTRPATVVAVSELCRVVAKGLTVAPGPLEAAVADVPTDHFAYAVLSTAVRHLRLAAAVRAKDPAAIRALVGAAPTGLAGLLDALGNDDSGALRGAIKNLAGELASPRYAAVVGASYLELPPDPPDLTVAIHLLSKATRELGDPCLGLRTRSWWRLATACRRRGAPGDAELSREAGMNALAGGGQDKASAAWFAGRMLTEGYSAEAFTALEVAAVASDRSVQLAEEVLDLLLGIDPQASPPVAVPTPAEVASAVREVGAAALLYLHPTDDAGRRLGVLCLDPVTGQLDVLANVPVNGSLPLDDPGWSAITRRWSTGSLLVAATGEFGRIALPAVCTDENRRFAQDVSVTYVSSGRRVIALASRTPVTITDAPLFVVNPRGDRDSEMAEVLVLRRLFYPRSTCVGRAIELVDAAGTRDGVLSRLPAASMAHLACGLRHGGVPALLLADGDELAVRDENLHGRGLVVLAEPDTEGFGVIADAFLDAGFSSAIGWQWTVPPPFAELALFMTHVMLVDHYLPPAKAVNAVHRWMLDPDRDLAPLLTGAHLKTVETVDLTRPALWAALACRG